MFHFLDPTKNYHLLFLIQIAKFYQFLDLQITLYDYWYDYYYYYYYCLMLMSLLLPNQITPKIITILSAHLLLKEKIHCIMNWFKLNFLNLIKQFNWLCISFMLFQSIFHYFRIKKAKYVNYFQNYLIGKAILKNLLKIKFKHFQSHKSKIKEIKALFLVLNLPIEKLEIFYNNQYRQIQIEFRVKMVLI